MTTLSTVSDYKQELGALKPHDEVRYSEYVQDFLFLATCGHGYLVVPKDSEHAATAKKICEYGYKGQLAYYLEEDCELSEFLEKIK